jgi:hypothetical protein
LKIERASELFEGVIDRALPQLPPGKRKDPRIEPALQVRVNPTCPRTELAPKLQISSDHLSCLFAQVVGLPWRSYFFHRDYVHVVRDPHLLEAGYVEMDDQALGLAKGSVCQHCGSVLSQ